MIVLKMIYKSHSDGDQLCRVMYQSIEDASLEPLLTSSEASVSGSLRDLFDSNNKLTTLLQSVRSHSSRRALLFLLRSVLVYSELK